MNKRTKPMNQTKRPTKSISGDKQHGIVVTDLLFALSTIGAAVLVAAMHSPKLPPANGD